MNSKIFTVNQIKLFNKQIIFVIENTNETEENTKEKNLLEARNCLKTFIPQ